MDKNSTPWVDSHCHLEMLKGDISTVLENGFQEGLAFCVSVGTSAAANQKVIELCDKYDDVFGTLGFHPHAASQFDTAQLDGIKKEIVSNQKIVAVGGCGFDFYYNRSRKKDQKEAFSAQLDLAVESGVPVVMHTRDADAEVKDMLQCYRGVGLRGVVHSFTSTVEQARYLLDFGFYLSFNGISTYPKAGQVRDVLKYTPKDRILLETDAPYLSPVPLRGKPNVPGNVSIVGRFVAEFLKLSPDYLAQLVLQNTLTLFPRIKYEH
ncbi:MAG: TatD family hydrolase [SAR324 cluster bacterium]|nr:TatD family hydrolase [SAR324 cluster bacterium]